MSSALDSAPKRGTLDYQISHQPELSVFYSSGIPLISPIGFELLVAFGDYPRSDEGPTGLGRGKSSSFPQRESSDLRDEET